MVVQANLIKDFKIHCIGKGPTIRQNKYIQIIKKEYKYRYPSQIVNNSQYIVSKHLHLQFACI